MVNPSRTEVIEFDRSVRPKDEILQEVFDAMWFMRCRNDVLTAIKNMADDARDELGLWYTRAKSLI